MASPPRLDALNGLRFLACVEVALAHMPHLHNNESISLPLRRCLIGPGFAVPFFFVLSGFILAYRYRDEFAVLTRDNLRHFYFNRFVRVWPVHLLTFCFAIYYSSNPKHVGSWDSAILNLLLVQCWPPSLTYGHGYNSTSWTLSIEVFFYLCFPALMWLFMRRKLGGATLLLIGLAAWLLPLGNSIYFTYHPSEMAVYYVSICPLARLGDFVIGMLVGIAFSNLGAQALAPASSKVAVLWTGLETAAMLLIVGLIYYAYNFPLLVRINGYYTLAAALLVGVFAFQRGYLSWLLSTSGPAYLGEITFSFFMLHTIVFVWMNLIFPGEIGPWSRASLYLQVAAAAAVIMYHGYELPATALLKYLAQRVRKPTAEVAPATAV